MTPVDEIIRAFDMDMYRHMFRVKSIDVDDRTWLALLSSGNLAYTLQYEKPDENGEIVVGQSPTIRLGRRFITLICASGPIRIYEEVEAMPLDDRERRILALALLDAP